MFERFTKKTRRVVLLAQETARRRGDGYIGTEHLLLALLQVPDCLAATVLTAHGVTLARSTEAVDQRLGAHGRVTNEDVAVLEDLGIDAAAILEQARDELGRDAALPSGVAAADRRRWRLVRRRQGGCSGSIPFTPKAKKVLELSLREALQLGDNYIGTEHVLLGLIRGKGVGRDVLVDLGVDVDALRQAALDARPQAA